MSEHEKAIEAARDAMARHDITFAHCDSKWQISAIEKVISAYLSAIGGIVCSREPVERRIRKAGQVAIDGVIDGWTDRACFPTDDDLADYLTRIVDACVRAALSDDGTEAMQEGSETPAPQAHVVVSERPDGWELSRVRAVDDEGPGMWRPCSGCHELNEGVPTGEFSHNFNCFLGIGCFECGGIGAVWDTTDYEDMGNCLAEQAIASEKQPDTRHEFVPNKKYPWFCAHCGYAPHEPLKHIQPASADLAATSEGSTDGQ